MPVQVVWLLLVLAAEPISGETSLTATTSTQTNSQDLSELLKDLGEIPLSPKELELLKKLETSTATPATTATATPRKAPAPKWWPAPGPFRVTRMEKPERTVSRSAAEALEVYPSRHLGFAGERAVFIWDGVVLEPFLFELLGVEPWFFDRFELRIPGPLTQISRGNALHLHSRAPPTGRALSLAAAAIARSADRSTGLYGTIGASLPVAAVRASLSYRDAKDLRITGNEEFPGASQRWTAALRGRLFGRPNDIFELNLGLDFDRALNAPFLGDEVSKTGVVNFDQKLLGYLQAKLTLPKWEIRMLAAYQGQDRQRESLPTPITVLDTKADAFQLRAHAQFNPFATPKSSGWLATFAGGHLSFSNARTMSNPSLRRLEAYAGGTLKTAGVHGGLTVRLSNQRLRVATQGTEEEQTRALVEGSAWLPIYGPLALRAGFDQGIALGCGSLCQVAQQSVTEENAAQRDFRLSFGPSFSKDGLWLELGGFFAQYEDPIASLENPSANIPLGQVRAFGLELEGRWTIIKGLHLAGVLVWAEAFKSDDKQATLTIPSVRGLATLRYRFAVRNAYIELRVGGSSEPLHVFGRAPDSGFLPYASLGTQPEGSVRLGLMGGLDLGWGFRLDLSIENVLDGRYQSHAMFRPSPGIDLRSALSYEFEL